MAGYPSGLSRTRLSHQNHNRRSSNYQPHDAGDRRDQGDADTDCGVPGDRPDHVRQNDNCPQQD